MKQKLIIAGILACLLCSVTAQRVVKLTATPPAEPLSVSISQGDPYENNTYDDDWNIIDTKTVINLSAYAIGGGGYYYYPMLFRSYYYDMDYLVPGAGNGPRFLSGIGHEYNWTTDQPELILEGASSSYLTILPPTSRAGFTVTATIAQSTAKASIAIWPISVEGEAIGQKIEALYYPTSKQLELKSEDISLQGKKLMLAVFNTSGTMLYNETQAVDNIPFSTIIDLPHLQAGVYILSVQHNSGRFSYSFIVKQ